MLKSLFAFCYIDSEILVLPIVIEFNHYIWYSSLIILAKFKVFSSNSIFFIITSFINVFLLRL